MIECDLCLTKIKKNKTERSMSRWKNINIIVQI